MVAGSHNTFVGVHSGKDATGSANTLIGAQAGKSNYREVLIF